MEKRELLQLKFLNSEIEMLKKQLDTLEYTVRTDSVKGSYVHHPYIQHSIKIEGIDQREYDRKAKKIKNQIQRRMNELMDEMDKMNAFIAEISDSEARMIFALRYINGLTWRQIAAHIGGGNTEDSVRMMHNRILKKVETRSICSEKKIYN